MIGTKPQSHQSFVAWVAALLGLVLLVSVLSNLSVGRSFMKKEVGEGEMEGVTPIPGR